MAKSKGGKFYKAMLAGTGLHRIDGIVREVNDAGVMIDIKEAGRQKRAATLIPMSAVRAHTGEGPGFVIANVRHEFEPIAGEVVSEDETGITIKDAEGIEITFPAAGGEVQFVQVGEDDRFLKRGAVQTKIARLAEREDGSDGKSSKKSKKDKKSKKSDGGEKSSKSDKKRRRRR